LPRLLLARVIFDRLMVATRGMPPARVKILRHAYYTPLKNPALLEELKKKRWVVDSISGEELVELAQGVISSRPTSSNE
jgi:hypothetical protein